MIGGPRPGPGEPARSRRRALGRFRRRRVRRAGPARRRRVGRKRRRHLRQHGGAPFGGSSSASSVDAALRANSAAPARFDCPDGRVHWWRLRAVSSRASRASCLASSAIRLPASAIAIARGKVAALATSSPSSTGQAGPRRLLRCETSWGDAPVAAIEALTARVASGTSRSLRTSGCAVASAGRRRAARQARWRRRALGISGPAGWGLVAAAIRRRLADRPATQERQRSSSLAARPTDQEATAAAEAPFRRDARTSTQRQPIERDDREARELLRLSQLEGRDPLQDAVAGRIRTPRN